MEVLLDMTLASLYVIKTLHYASLAGQQKAKKVNPKVTNPLLSDLAIFSYRYFRGVASFK